MFRYGFVCAILGVTTMAMAATGETKGVPLDFDCPAESGFSLEPQDSGGNIFFSDPVSDSKQAEKFSGVTAPIGGIRYWGSGINDSFQACDRDPDEVLIEFYQDNLGSPGDLVHSETVVAPESDTDFNFGAFDINMYEVTLSDTVNLSTGWVSVSGANSTGCQFNWYTSGDGDNRHSTLRMNGSVDTFSEDLAVCLITVDAAEGEGEGGGEGVPGGEGGGEAAETYGGLLLHRW